MMLAMIRACAVPDVDFYWGKRINVPGQGGGHDGGEVDGPSGCLRLGRPEVRLLASHTYKLLSDIDLTAQEVHGVSFQACYLCSRKPQPAAR